MSLLDVPIGPNAPHEFNTIIEIPKGSTNKYEMDAETGVMGYVKARMAVAMAPETYSEVKLVGEHVLPHQLRPTTTLNSGLQTSHYHCA